MAKRIEKLSKEAVALIPVVRDEWLAAGLSTAPTDRAAALRGVHAAYEDAGLPHPILVIWLRSPFAGAIGSAMLSQSRDQVGAQVRAQVWAQVRAQVGDQVWAQVRAQVGDQVRAQVGDQVWAQVGAQVRDQVRDQVWAQVGAQVRDQVRAQVGDQVRDQVGDQVGTAVWGQHDAGWLAFYDFFGRAYKLKGTKRLEGLNEVARSAGWWWPFRNAVILTERPISLARDDEGRLHSESGAALLYSDGWGIWSVHGVRVSQQTVDAPETLTVAQILGEENAEVRRVMMERFGADRLMREANAEVVSQDDYGKLWRLPVEGDEPLVMVEVVNSTPEPSGEFKDYWLRVPPDVESAHGAVAWSFGMTVKSYRPAVET
jgi:hypothetical protein